MPITDQAPEWRHAQVVFTENVGQAPGNARYVSMSMGYELQITERGATLVIPSKDSVGIQFAGGAAASKPVAEAPNAAKFQYYKGREAHTDRPSFERVRQTNVYPGIDAVYYGTQSAIEYDMIVHPGADPSRIQVRLDGASRPVQQADGSIVVSHWRHNAPVAYQTIGGQRKAVESRARLEGNVVRFELGEYDKAHDLVIDPVLATVANPGSLSFSAETGIKVAPDNSFAIFDTDAEVMRIGKFSNAGALQYLFVFDGNNIDSVLDVALSSSGLLYATGRTSSTNLPTTSTSFQRNRNVPICNFLFIHDCASVVFDAHAIRLSSTGTLQWATYLGSNSVDIGRQIRVHTNGNVYVAGNAGGVTFPKKNEFQGCVDDYVNIGSAFLTVLNNAGTALVYSTCIHPTLQTFASLKSTQAMGLVIDSTGNAYMTGLVSDGIGTSSFPVRGANNTSAFQTSSNGPNDAFIAKFDPSRAGDSSLIYSTLLGGGNIDSANSISVNASGEACIAGETQSIDFPLRAPAGTQLQLNGHRGGVNDLFVTCVNANGSDLLFSNLYGGTGFETLPTIASDGAGNLWVAAKTDSNDLATVLPFEDGTGAASLLLKLAANTREVKLLSRTPTLVESVATSATKVFASGQFVDEVIDCAKEVPLLQITQGPILFDAFTGRFRQTINVAHIGPLLTVQPGTRLVITALPPTASLFGATGTTACFDPGSPFITLGAIPHVNQGGLNVNVEFVVAKNTGVTHIPKVVSSGVNP